jgi:CHAD domain-containing protein
MSFSFREGDDVAQQVRDIALGQARKALESARSGADFDKTVHGLRRRCKKLRGLVRLVKPNFKQFQRENADLREAANLFGSARDARVMVETLDTLTGVGQGLLAVQDASAARHMLVDRAERLANSGEHQDELDQFITIIEAFSQRAEDWSFETKGFALVGDGLEKTYRQFTEGFIQALELQTPEDMHEWRKQAKYHFFHVSLLADSAPDVLGAREKLLDRLGEHLGDHHNLAVLEATLREEGNEIGETDAIFTAIQEQQARLADSAFALGRQLTAEKPAALRRRFKSFWTLLPEDA